MHSKAAQELRRKAAAELQAARKTRVAKARETRLKIAQGYKALAESADWLAGETPPAKRSER